MRGRPVFAILAALILPGAAIGGGDTKRPDAATPSFAGATRLVLLGTGNPNPDPERQGPALAIVTGGRAYLVDCGTGVVRRAAAAASKHAIPELEPERLGIVFVTHLHSDHTLGLADLILTPWIMGREAPLQAYGPPGLQRMTGSLLEAYREDIDVRLRGNQPSTPEGWKVQAHEVKPGPVFRDERVTVRAFRVSHGAWKHAYGFRFEAPDRTIVISGDTVAQESVAEACNGCDVLVHEAYAQAGFDGRSKEWQSYHAVSHTSAPELAAIARKARPGLLVLVHQMLWGSTPEDLLSEIKAAGYAGRVVYGNDLEVY